MRLFWSIIWRNLYKKHPIRFDILMQFFAIFRNFWNVQMSNKNMWLSGKKNTTSWKMIWDIISKSKMSFIKDSKIYRKISKNFLFSKYTFTNLCQKFLIKPPSNRDKPRKNVDCQSRLSIAVQNPRLKICKLYV